MWWIIGGVGAFMALIASYSAVVVGARADRDLEQWLAEKRREG